ncbi:xylanase [Emticicia sp. ODNR4P]|nr:xylanase [Emticicia sp. ODNR4P]
MSSNNTFQNSFKKWLLTGALGLGFSSFAQAQVQPIVVKLNPQKTFQIIEHFGGSDAWAAQFVGNWPDAKRKAISKLLFSQALDKNGKPEGIGLSLWRFNVGAGSAEQGKESGIKDEWRRAESFLNNDGSYNWEKQAAQIWFLQEAKKYNVDKFLAFTNSPPVQFTTNKKAFATEGKPNLAPEQYDNFARFLTEVVKGVKQKTGITFDYVSATNEPQWDWSDGGQEGTPFDNEHIAGINKALSKKLLAAKLSTEISIAEAGQLNYLYSPFNKPARGSQIEDFFQKSGKYYLGDLPNLNKSIGGHSYFTTSPYKDASQMRKQLASTIAKVEGLHYWMTEYCILGDNAGEIEGNGKDLGINAALYVAKVIHNDLVNGNASAWHWWTSISAYNYKDGLVYIDKNKTDGKYEDSKMLWAFGNFSRFVRPGAQRIEADLAQEVSEKLSVSAYKDVKRKQTIVVLINHSSEALAINLDGIKAKKTTVYQTTENANLQPVKVNKLSNISIPARSVVTLLSSN